MVIWVTGLSGVGKTTLCNALFSLLKPHLPGLILLEGQELRAAFGYDLGYSEQDRVVQVKRLQNIAKLLSEQDLIVIVAALYSNPELLAWNRRNLNDYFEVYLEASLDALRVRDTKGLYAKAFAGEIAHVVGVDIPWRAPVAPDLVIYNNNPEPPDFLAEKVVASVPWLADALNGRRAWLSR